VARQLTAGNARPLRIEVASAGSGVNEDIAGVHPPYFWVIDASTPLFKARVTSEPSDALWLAKRIDDYLHTRIVREQGSISLSPLIEGLAAAVGRELRSIGAPRGPEGLSAAIGIIRIDGKRLDYLILGDVTLAVANGRTVRLLRDERVTRFDRAAIDVLKAELEAGAPYARARKRTFDRLREHRKYMNVESGYWILSNRVSAVRRAESGTLRISPGARALLTSDGFSRVVDLFHLYRGWRGLLAMLRQESLTSILSELRRAELADPESRRFPRLAPHDDATALFVETESSRSRP
jgi:hypothetical protein